MAALSTFWETECLWEVAEEERGGRGGGEEGRGEKGRNEKDDGEEESSQGDQ